MHVMYLYVSEFVCPTFMPGPEAGKPPMLIL